MKAIEATITGSATVFGALNITLIYRFIYSSMTQPGEPVYNLKTIKPCTAI